jgi:hypothetical protein
MMMVSSYGSSSSSGNNSNSGAGGHMNKIANLLSKMKESFTAREGEFSKNRENKTVRRRL